MPKGLHRIDLVMLERFRAKVAQTLNLSLNSNKNYDYFSKFIFLKTHVQDSGKFIHNTIEINIETTEVNIADGSMNDDGGNANVEVLKINVDLAKVKDKFVKININLLLFSFVS